MSRHETPSVEGTQPPMDLGSPQAILAAIVEASTPPARESNLQVVSPYTEAEEALAREEESFQ